MGTEPPNRESGACTSRACKRLEIQGLVQGVGFRPFVFKLAQELALGGFVENTGDGVCIEIEGGASDVAAFVARLHAELPPLARIDRCHTTDTTGAKRHGFRIRESNRTGPMRALVSPDMATCAACIREIGDPTDRRYRYPFTNCTNCGPRYSIIESMPYDRPFTTMAGFTMCAACRSEYEDPSDRRFHAQPIACPDCGPQLALWSPEGAVLATREAALAGAVDALRAGQILALKGLGGFQLLVDACDEAAVCTLRARKQREGKPFALMFPTLDAVPEYGEVTSVHAALLASSEAPIVLIPACTGTQGLAPSIAPDTYLLGIMLPYTPLHHLLLTAFGGPLIVTSGNLGEEPICIDELAALRELAGVPDRLLVHDRPIARQVDDSIVTVIHGAPMLLRRARGYAPAPLPVGSAAPDALAVGGHLKNSVACRKAGVIYPSQHIGNLESMASRTAFERTIESMQRLFAMAPAQVLHDLHPDYASTRYAATQQAPRLAVQHHFAHVLSCMAEHNLEGPVLGVSWDGTGYGTDGTVWGGEFLHCTRSEFTRVAMLRPFRLPGGEAAARDGRRCAISLLHELYGAAAFPAALPVLHATSPHELRTFRAMLEKNINTPMTTSMGRLFDAVASLIGIGHHNTFEGQAAMRLERAAVCGDVPAWPLGLEVRQEAASLLLDWQPLIAALIVGLQQGTTPDALAKGFHAALVAGVEAVARAVGTPEVVLTGGCFQNTLLLENTAAALRRAGFTVYCHAAIPPNDGGIAVGQAWYVPPERGPA